MNRDEFAAEGVALANRIGVTAPSNAPGLAEFAAEAGFASIWAREALPPEDRIIVVLATLTSLQRLPQLRAHIVPALDLGISARGVQEIIVQCGLYGGLPVAEEALKMAASIFNESGIEMPELTADEQAMRGQPMEDLSSEGHRIMAEIHGDRSQSGYAAPEDPATSALYMVAIEYGYGVIWTRAGLSWRQRMFVALAAFTALRLEATLTKFAQSAIVQGITREQVIEAIMQTAPYGGFPPALIALSQVKPVLFPEA
jgi:4-carboxymuconolactone decarboxylase